MSSLSWRIEAFILEGFLFGGRKLSGWGLHLYQCGFAGSEVRLSLCMLFQLNLFVWRVMGYIKMVLFLHCWVKKRSLINPILISHRWRLCKEFLSAFTQFWFRCLICLGVLHLLKFIFFNNKLRLSINANFHYFWSGLIKRSLALIKFINLKRIFLKMANSQIENLSAIMEQKHM